MIKEPFKNSFQKIKNNKSRFATIVVVQLLFLFTISIAAFFTIIPAIEEGKQGMEIYDQLAIQNQEQPQLQQQDAAKIYRSFQNMLTYFERGGIAIAIAFILINGVAWLLAQSMIRKINTKTYVNIVIIGLITSIAIQQLITSYLKTALTGINEQQYLPTGVALTVIAVISFLSYTAFATTHHPIKQIPKKILSLIINKGHLLLLFFLINILLVALPMYLFMTTIDGYLAIPLIAIFTTLAITAYTKVLWLTAIES
jgi:hypothetical protein